MKPTLLVLSFLIFSLFSCRSTSQGGKKGQPIFVAPVGVQAYSFRNYFPKSIPGTLDQIQNMGIKEIEGSAGSIAPESYRKLCDERNIRIASTGASFKQLEEDPQEIANTARILGAKYVMCAWIPHNSDKFDKETADKAIEVFNAAGKILTDNGLTFCYHPHGYEFQKYQDGTLLDYMIENTNPEYVSYEMDIFWIQFGGGDPVELLKKYSHRWKLMHLKDMKRGTKKDLTGHTDVNNNVPLGSGELDMREIMIIARRIGIAHYFIEDESSLVVSQIPESIAYLRSLTY